ncbi:MAG TPA: alpha/beta hydrolase [Acidimicrobiales bacterium]|jgi:acetyl esterase/lipase|nr:alpha/beta hydrolase [Acidimicrobiales bacterium]
MIDPELEVVLELLPVLDLADPVAARAGFEAMLLALRSEIPGIDTLDIEDRFVPGWEGDPDVGVRIYRPKDRVAAAPAVVLIHGGGFIIGSVEAEHVGAAMLSINTGAVVVSVEYRLAPEHPFPAGLHDCYAALSFAADPAGELGVDPERIAVVGTSAGGGLGAATTLLARDLGGPAICFQMLHIPELDDRLTTPSMQRFVDSPIWNQPLAVQSWRAYLGPEADPDEVSPYAAPARARDLSGLPPAYISTAENDPLRDEGILYALGLLQAGVSVELHQFPGTYHGSALVTSAAVSRRAQKESTVALRRGLGLDD